MTSVGSLIRGYLTKTHVRTSVAVWAMVHDNNRNECGLLELVSPIIRRNPELICGDFRDTDLCRRAIRGCGVVMHLETLVLGHRNLLRGPDENVL